MNDVFSGSLVFWLYNAFYEDQNAEIQELLKYSTSSYCSSESKLTVFCRSPYLAQAIEMCEPKKDRITRLGVRVCIVGQNAEVEHSL